jgi:UDP-N-acetylmuramoylalanine--D-glutamate ligase
MEAYAAAKAHILDYQSARDTAVLGFDDPVARSFARRVKGTLWMFVGDGSRLPQDWSRLPHASVREGHVVLAQDRQARHLPPALGSSRRGAALRAGGRASLGVQVCRVSDIQLRGEHNLLNVLAACALAGAAGIEPEAMRKAIIEFTGVAHRLQLVRVRNGVSYYDDSIATAPERLIAALKAFHEPIVLLAGGRDKHLPWDEAARLIRQRVRRLILFGEMAGLVENAVRSAARDASHDVLQGQYRVDTLAEAVVKAAEVAQAGDVVLLSPGGTSFDAFKDFAERGDRFQEYVRQL